MTAMTEARLVPSRGPEGKTRFVPVAAATIILNGSLVMGDASGNAVTGAKGVSAALPVLGIAEETIDNTDGSAGDEEVRVKTGIYGFGLDGTNTPTAAMIGDLMYLEDDQTVASTNTGSRPAAGWLYEIRDSVAYVEVPGRTLV
jgi:hypothetical protein